LIRVVIGLISTGALAFASYASAASAKTIWLKGGSIKRTCTASVGGNRLMSGPCSGLGHGNTLFVTAERDGCSDKLQRTKTGITGKIFAYKDACGDLENDVSVGVFVA